MKVLLDIPDNKEAFVMELLDAFNFIKKTTITSDNEDILNNLQQSVKELNLINEGKLESSSAREFLNEL